MASLYEDITTTIQPKRTENAKRTRTRIDQYDPLQIAEANDAAQGVSVGESWTQARPASASVAGGMAAPQQAAPQQAAPQQASVAVGDMTPQQMVSHAASLAEQARRVAGSDPYQAMLFEREAGRINALASQKTYDEEEARTHTRNYEIAMEASKTARMLAEGELQLAQATSQVTLETSGVFQAGEVDDMVAGAIKEGMSEIAFVEGAHTMLTKKQDGYTESTDGKEPLPNVVQGPENQTLKQELSRVWRGANAINLFITSTAFQRSADRLGEAALYRDPETGEIMEVSGTQGLDVDSNLDILQNETDRAIQTLADGYEADGTVTLSWPEIRNRVMSDWYSPMRKYSVMQVIEENKEMLAGLSSDEERAAAVENLNAYGNGLAEKLYEYTLDQIALRSGPAGGGTPDNPDPQARVSASMWGGSPMSVGELDAANAGGAE